MGVSIEALKDHFLTLLCIAHRSKSTDDSPTHLPQELWEEICRYFLAPSVKVENSSLIFSAKGVSTKSQMINPVISRDIGVLPDLQKGRVVVQVGLRKCIFDESYIHRIKMITKAP